MIVQLSARGKNGLMRGQLFPINQTFVPFSYPDYPQDVVQKFIKASSRMIGGLNATLTVTTPLVVVDHIKKVWRQIRDVDSDLIVALLVTCVEAPNLVATLREFSVSHYFYGGI